jgi:hypothetical protein
VFRIERTEDVQHEGGGRWRALSEAEWSPRWSVMIKGNGTWRIRLGREWRGMGSVIEFDLRLLMIYCFVFALCPSLYLMP